MMCMVYQKQNHVIKFKYRCFHVIYTASGIQVYSIYRKRVRNNEKKKRVMIEMELITVII